MPKLKNVCTISSGQTFRKKVEHNPNGDVAVIQMKDMNDDYTGVAKNLSCVALSEVAQKQILQPNDVLFLARGNNNKAFVFNTKQPTVAVSLFFILRPNTEFINPNYLAWYLNQPNTQNYLFSSQEGATVASIKKHTLEDMEIQLPSLADQNNIANIYALHLREMQLMDNIRTKRNELINGILLEKI